MTNPDAIFVDTWGWMALGHRRESRHDEVRQVYQECLSRQIPLYTSDYVLDEVVTLLFRREAVGESIRFVEGVLSATAVGHIRLERLSADLFFAAWELRKRLQDKPGISFTDLTSMVIMMERGITKVLTEDEHFTHVGMGFCLTP